MNFCSAFFYPQTLQLIFLPFTLRYLTHFAFPSMTGEWGHQRGLGVPALIAAEEFLGRGSRRGHSSSALQTPFCPEQPRALAADISLALA